ncbi:MAG: hypothetical protein HND58_06380 [Planctomycetota bacterium]|nr:MAG: hypothetical protein HND58_06380 [Planctomycetota bacterium]
MTQLLGIDVGTSSTKAVVCDARGTIVATASAPHTLLTPNPGWSEQEPEGWWKAAVQAIHAVLGSPGVSADAIAGVGLSGQMHGSVLLPESALTGDASDARALRPALLWNDQRTAAECAAIEAAAGGCAGLVEMVGNAALTGFTLPKLLWVRKHEPEIWARVAGWCLPKDFVRLRLTGEFAADVGDAAGTLLFDVDRRGWSARAHALLDLDPGLAAPVLESCAVAGRVTTWAAAQTGLPEGTPVVAGSGDNQCGAVGAGVVEPGLVLATLGTSGVIYAHSDLPRKDLGSDTAAAGARPHHVRRRRSFRRTRPLVAHGVHAECCGVAGVAPRLAFPRCGLRHAAGRGRGRTPGCHGAGLPAASDRRAVPAPGPGRPRGVHRSDGAARAGASCAGGGGGRDADDAADPRHLLGGRGRGVADQARRGRGEGRVLAAAAGGYLRRTGRAAQHRGGARVRCGGSWRASGRGSGTTSVPRAGQRFA